MIVLAVTERNLPLLQFFAAFSVELQATITRSTDVIPKDISHVVQHANHTGRDGFGWQGTAFRCWWSAFKCSLLQLVAYNALILLLNHLHYFTYDHITHGFELFLLRERHTCGIRFRVKTECAIYEFAYIASAKKYSEYFQTCATFYSEYSLLCF